METNSEKPKYIKPANMEFRGPPTGPYTPVRPPDWPAPLKFEEVITPTNLRLISEATGGFRFAADPELANHFYQTGELKTGYTMLSGSAGGTIYYNPILLNGVPELDLKPWRSIDIRGFTRHESGHHA